MKKVIKISAEKGCKNTDKMLRVAAYCRVSTDCNAQLESLEAQKNHYENYILNQEGWEFAGLYFDQGISGTKKEKRPDLLRMMADSEAGKIDFIITKSISRLARNTADCLEMVRKLLVLNIPIYFEKENLNTGTMESELILSVLSSMAEGESVSISKNNTWSVKRRFQNGTFKPSSVPYGYHWNGESMEIDPKQAETVRWIFTQVLFGKGADAIAAELNEKGIPSKKGGGWTASTILGMIVNEKYIGEAVFQKTYTDSQFNRHTNHGEQDKYRIIDHHEPIISSEAFNTAGAVVAQHRREKGIVKGCNKYQSRYAFSGKLICNECGGTFKRQTHFCTAYQYAAWCCNTHIKDIKRCSMQYIRDDEIKTAFVTMINKLIFAHKIVLKPYAASMKNNSKELSLRRIQEIKTLLLKNENERETLSKLMAQGYIDQVLYTKENNMLLSQAENYRSEMEMLHHNITGDTGHIAAAQKLLHFTEKSEMLEAFDDALFEETVDHIKVISRQEIAFSLKCALTLKERIG